MTNELGKPEKGKLDGWRLVFKNVIYSQVKDLIVFARLQLNRTTETQSGSAT